MTHTDVSIRVAKRTDHGDAFSEEAGFFGPGPQRLFGVLHRPAGPPRGGLVICPPIHMAFITGYRADVSLARRLAAGGVAVQRFHYRGVGHSDGEVEETTFATMREDALAATHHLLEETSIGEPIFLGTRFGGLVAASAASEHPERPLVLLDPALDASRFFREAWRAGRIRDVKEGTSPPAVGHGLAETLAGEQTVDVLGEGIHRSLVDSAADRTLVGELGEGARRVLLVQLGRASSLRRDLEVAAEALRGLGCDVRVELVAEDVAGWFLPDHDAKQREPLALTEVTSAWVRDELGAELP